MDIVDRSTRSRMMAGIRGKDTKPEHVVRAYVHRSGLRFRLHAALVGKPDLVLPKYRTVVFVHGCFWHRHPGCHYSTTPASNVMFWRKKFAGNVRRDAWVERQLVKLGWRVLIIWSCELNHRKLTRLVNKIRKGANAGSQNGKSRQRGQMAV